MVLCVKYDIYALHYLKKKKFPVYVRFYSAFTAYSSKKRLSHFLVEFHILEAPYSFCSFFFTYCGTVHSIFSSTNNKLSRVSNKAVHPKAISSRAVELSSKYSSNSLSNSFRTNELNSKYILYRHQICIG